jgi:hypothetical protein
MRFDPRFSTVVLTSSANEETIMPLYLEILDHDPSARDSVLHDGADASILDLWLSETTGETVRLVDAPHLRETPRATARAARILLY